MICIIFQPHTPRLTYFTDLAELVSKIDEPTSSVSLYDNEDEEISGNICSLKKVLCLFKYNSVFIIVLLKSVHPMNT